MNSLGVEHFSHNEPRDGTQANFEERHEAHDREHSYYVRREAQERHGHYKGGGHHASRAPKHQRHPTRLVHELKGNIC